MIDGEIDAKEYVAQRCDARALDMLDRLIELLREENTRQNLVSSGSLDAVWQRHIADSAQLLDRVPRGSEALPRAKTDPWLDLGTGAGFPGIVIAIMRSELQVVVVESRKRRSEWLESLVGALELANCTVEGRKIESVETFAAGVISARAFAPLGKMIELARRFSTSDTWWLLPKGRSAAQEVAQLPPNLRTMFHVEQSATDGDSGIVVGRIIESQRR